MTFQMVMKFPTIDLEAIDGRVNGRELKKGFRRQDERSVQILQVRTLMKEIKYFRGMNEHEGVMEENIFSDRKQRATGRVSRGIASVKPIV
jgi:hypothetical protein